MIEYEDARRIFKHEFSEEDLKEIVAQLKKDAKEGDNRAVYTVLRFSVGVEETVNRAHSLLDTIRNAKNLMKAGRSADAENLLSQAENQLKLMTACLVQEASWS